jgi:YHS domain-containing protein
MKIVSMVLAAAAALSFAGCGKEEAAKASSAVAKTSEPSAAKSYPLKTCLVSGEELGKMGEPVRIVYEGQEIKFCCKSCEPEFRKDPAKFLKKLP